MAGADERAGWVTEDVSEAEWQRQVVRLLNEFGYVCDHVFRLRCHDGSWRTGNTLAGRPDVIALRPPRLLAIELKAERGVLDRRQRACLSLYAEVPGARAWVLRPSDLDVAREWFRRPGPAPAVYGFERMTQLEAYRVVAPASARAPR